MTNDFKDQFCEALKKEGYEYVILYWKDLNKGAQVSSKVDDLDSEFTFPNGRTVTKKESIVELAEFAIE